MPPDRSHRPREVDPDLGAGRRSKTIACQKCHARKVRCPGGQPCETCVQLNCVAECVYPKRDRQIKISQNYLERVLKENDSLRARHGRSEKPSPEPAADYREEPTQNPLLDERPWFLPVHSSRIPALIGEVADPAFATRIRQTISKSPQNHILRTAYPVDDPMPDCGVPGLNHAHARFLLKTTLAYLDGRYHIVRKSAVWDLFEQYIQAPASLDPLSRYKISALFAFGELYSSQSTPAGGEIPGMAFFQDASKAYGALHERPTADYVETCLILALYSLHINRRHSAYFLASSAIRHSIVMGLHFDVPDFQIQDAGIREHLKRLWWTSYLLDHQCATISSQATSVSDNEILVDLPSVARLSETHTADFQHTAHLVARISLAKLTNKIVRTIYGRSAHTDPFLHRVQSALKDLQQWNQALPESLKETAEGISGLATLNLRLFFNQCLILATRPVLLYVARVHMTAGGSSPSIDNLHSNTRAPAEACIRCARDSFNIITETWIGGSFRAFDYFTTQHLFSAATILAIASLLDSSEEDRHKFELAGQLLEKLKNAGSFPAREYCQHLDGIKADMQRLSAEPQSCHNAIAGLQSNDETQPAPVTELRADCVDADAPFPQQVASSSAVFTEPSICAFLAQDEFYPAQLDDFVTNTQMQGIYWPILDSNADTTG